MSYSNHVRPVFAPRQPHGGLPTNGASALTAVATLPYHPPYDWSAIVRFLAARALTGIEHVTGGSYARTVHIGDAKGWIRITPAEDAPALTLEVADTLMPVLPLVVTRMRALFDLDARPDTIARHLSDDPRLAAAVGARPGIRVPGAFDGFELGVRAILGQQVTVRAATTIAGRFVETFGEPIATPFPELNRLTPAPSRVAAASVDEIARLGIVSARCRSIIALADAHHTGGLRLDGLISQDPADVIGQLTKLPGIGPWTAHYIAMRALHWADAFPKEDIAVRNALGGLSAREAETLSQAWRPWRSYAVMYLWLSS
ncbi:MAG TPA: AlkA N-terminal domain-containing protein [Vicinamibacterales bacterium]|jgi:AraC family transcriptional regulator of adaptative response / DNA-3-methyladenine glycosylase II